MTLTRPLAGLPSTATWQEVALLDPTQPLTNTTGSLQARRTYYTYDGLYRLTDNEDVFLIDGEELGGSSLESHSYDLAGNRDLNHRRRQPVLRHRLRL